MPRQPLEERRRVEAGCRLPFEVELGGRQFLHHRPALVAGDPEHRDEREIRREDAVTIDRRLGRTAERDARGPQIRHPRDGVEHRRDRIAAAGDVDPRRIHRAGLNRAFDGGGQRPHP